jgi:hypothetical protein
MPLVVLQSTLCIHGDKRREEQVSWCATAADARAIRRHSVSLLFMQTVDQSMIMTIVMEMLQTKMYSRMMFAGDVAGPDIGRPTVLRKGTFLDIQYRLLNEKNVENQTVAGKEFSSL